MESIRAVRSRPRSESRAPRIDRSHTPQSRRRLRPTSLPTETSFLFKSRTAFRALGRLQDQDQVVVHIGVLRIQFERLFQILQSIAIQNPRDLWLRFEQRRLRIGASKL